MPITRDDIEAKLREVKGGLDETTEQAAPYAFAVGVVVVVAVVGLAFVLGRRRGRRRSTVVEIRRV